MIDKALIQDYIHRCDDVISGGNIAQAKSLFLEIQSVFVNDIPYFMSGLQSEIGSASLNWEYTNNNWLVDMPIIKSKLIRLLSTQNTQPTAPNVIINNANSNNASFNNTMNIESLLNITCYNINEMSSLSEEETKIAINKVNELADVIKSKENKKSKWKKLASIFKWLAEKSVDLVVAFSPLITQALSSLH